jgi:hypothetical protein
MYTNLILCKKCIADACDKHHSYEERDKSFGRHDRELPPANSPRKQRTAIKEIDRYGASCSLINPMAIMMACWQWTKQGYVVQCELMEAVLCPH